MKALTLIVVVLCLATQAEAKQRHRHSHHGFTCGIYMSAKNHTSYTPMARDWARKFPHTSAGPGAVVVQSRKGRALGGGLGGHVSQIIELTGTCRAIVNDNAGTYERDICRGLIAYVSPRG